MEQTNNLQELQDFVSKNNKRGVKGETIINQANHNAEEAILSDEDTAGRQVLQVLRIIVKTKEDAMYFEYVFNEPTELEEMNMQLEKVYAQFPRKIVGSEEMNELLSKV
ncbi:hypothetical protein QWT69_07460 [Sporosarcina oncorhynchi]|uniref:Uncharacterized protein n=1 Tax=Sporosarcina oncorhynchi TaxID=3056444 RepID=A0ABZ0LBG9_9BACL|nr:hypothetical protein [Sporosarcina sp. T2O-4]WOV88931.1 hypothetical protein QWT69_07460 [Sporosarcina sp. T2O-4]